MFEQRSRRGGRSPVFFSGNKTQDFSHDGNITSRFEIIWFTIYRKRQVIITVCFPRLPERRCLRHVCFWFSRRPTFQMSCTSGFMTFASDCWPTLIPTAPWASATPERSKQSAQLQVWSCRRSTFADKAAAPSRRGRCTTPQSPKAGLRLRRAQIFLSLQQQIDATHSATTTQTTMHKIQQRDSKVLSKRDAHLNFTLNKRLLLSKMTSN